MDKPAEIIVKEARGVINKADLAQLEGKTVLITGASGLVGTYLLASLRWVKEIKVVAVIRFRPTDYWRELIDFKGVKVMRGDLSKLSFCKKLPKADFIIHAAGYAQPSKFLVEPIKTLKLNTLTTYLLFDKLKSKGKFLIISSSEVYSGLNKSLYKETDIGTNNTDHSRACYIEGKRASEAIGYAYRQKGVEVKIIRLSFVYGPGTKTGDQRVMGEFIAKGLKGEIKLLDKGEALRTYIYITDVVEMMWRILLQGKEVIYNVGGESRTSIVGLAKKIGKYLQASVITPKRDRGIKGASKEVRMDLSKIKKEFKKTNFVAFDKGLKQTIDWQRLL